MPINTIELNNEAPHVNIKFGDKTYTIYNNDKNREVAMHLVMDFANSYKIIESPATEDKVTADKVADQRKFVDGLIHDIRDSAINALDELLGDKGIGLCIYNYKHKDTYALVEIIQQINEALQELQSTHKTELQRKYVKRNQPRRNNNRHKYNKNSANALPRNAAQSATR